MDQAQQLVRMIARAFYDTEHMVVIDALVKHSALSIEDYRLIFNNTNKHKQEIQKLCGRLREGGLVSVHSQLEHKANALKPTTVEYYFIDYRRAIDGTKYRLHTLLENLKRKAGPTLEKKEYKCQQCKSEWLEIEVIDKPDPHGRNSGFLCHKCGFPLDYFPSDAEATEADGPVGQFNKNMGWLINLMEGMDQVDVPEVTGLTAMRDKIPVPKEKAHLDNTKNEAFDAPKVKPQTVKGILSGPEKIEIAITTASESTAAQQAANAANKAKVAAQNQLPEWHTHSTVTNEMTAAGQREEVAKREREAELGTFANDATEEKKAAQGELDAVFAMIDAQREAARDDEEESEDDEEEDDFEEVLATETPPATKKLKLSDDVAKGDISSATNTPAAEAEESEDGDDFEDAIN